MADEPNAPATGAPTTEPDPDEDSQAQLLLADAVSRADDPEPPGSGDAKPDIPPAVKAALTKANKEAEKLRLKLKEYEDRDKTEAQKLTEAHAAAEARAADAEARLVRLEVAAEKGLTPAQAKRLLGSTREELEADADELIASFPDQTAPTSNGHTPIENLRPGALPTPQEPTLADRIAAAEKAGDWATARQLKSQQLLELQQKTT